MGNQHVSISEIYRVYKDFPKFEVSNFGNVRHSKSKKPKNQQINAQGYSVISFKENKKRYTLKVHRIVAELFLPAPCDDLILKCSKEHWGKVIVKHKDNDKLNNHYQNLEWSDLKGNTVQAWEDGLIVGLKGSENGRATLNEEVVHNLCKDFEDGMMPSEAVIKYNVSRAQATKIRAGFAWKHIWSQYKIKVNRR
jgi:hypothetical protein